MLLDKQEIHAFLFHIGLLQYQLMRIGENEGPRWNLKDLKGHKQVSVRVSKSNHGWEMEVVRGEVMNMVNMVQQWQSNNKSTD